jgi:hypothetical protein
MARASTLHHSAPLERSARLVAPTVWHLRRPLPAGRTGHRVLWVSIDKLALHS